MLMVPVEMQWIVLEGIMRSNFFAQTIIIDLEDGDTNYGGSKHLGSQLGWNVGPF